MIKDSIDDEKVNSQKKFDRFCYYLDSIHGEWSLFYFALLMEKVLVEQQFE